MFLSHLGGGLGLMFNITLNVTGSPSTAFTVSSLTIIGSNICMEEPL